MAAAFVRDPRIVAVWYKDIRVTVVHFVTWVKTGFTLFWQDLKTATKLSKRVLLGFPLTVRQRKLLVRTTSDCLKLIPFSFFIIVPFAEVLLPFALRLFPSMLPSTFFDKKVDNATLARKFKAKQELAEFWQQVVVQRTEEIGKIDNHVHSDKAEQLAEFQAKLTEANEFPTLKEILRFSKLFGDEMKLGNLNTKQLDSMSRLLGLSQSRKMWRPFVEAQLRHHVVSIRREDRDYLWEGIDGLSRLELIEACTKRAIRVSGVKGAKSAPKAEMRENLQRWLELSSHREIPTSALLWVQSFYLLQDEQLAGAGDVRSSLQLDVPPPKAEAGQAQEAFHDMADRQAARVGNLQRSLEELKAEIEEVVDKPVAAARDSHGMPKDSGGMDTGPGGILSSLSDADIEAESLQADPPSAERKQRAKVLRRLSELDNKAHLYKDVIDKQKSLLDHQLQFLNTFAENNGCQHRDPDVILLDQRVRLMEMIKSFETDYEAIEELLSGAKPSGKSSSPSRSIRLQ